jgi:hypothetical protein
MLGKCADVPAANSANGTGVEMWDCNGGANQEWIFETDGTVRPAFNTNKCLDIPAGNTTDGTRLEIWDCYAGDANQQWTLNTDGTLRGLGGKCMDDPAGNTADGTMFDYWTCGNGQSNQTFNRPAALMWDQDSTLRGVSGPGCGHEIAVGPNDVPWVVGCSPTNNADKWIYYLNPGQSCSNGFCLPSYSWTYAGATAVKVSVDLVGDAAIVGSNDHISWMNETKNGSGISVPSNSFFDITSSSPNVGGLVTDVVDLWHGPTTELEFKTAPDNVHDSWNYVDLWANGSGSPSSNRGIFRYDFFDGPKVWEPLPGGASGAKVAIFMQPSDPGSQTPWSMTVQGWLWRFNFGTSAFDSMPTPVMGHANDITDHFAVGGDGNVYEWIDNATSWQLYLGWAPSNLPIVKVAHAPSVNVNGTTFGPSHLWALDSAGNIWYAGALPGGPPP